MRVKKIVVLLILWLLAVSLTSCWDARDLEELLVVYGLGIDVSERNPEKYIVTMGFPTILAEAPEKKHEFSVEVDSIGEAKRYLQNLAYREITYGSIRIIIIGEDVAKQGIIRHLDALLREPLFPGTTRLAVVNQRADALLKFKPKVSLLVSSFLYESIKQSHHSTNVPFTTLRNFNYMHYTNGIQPSLPYIEFNENSSTMAVSSTALFNEDKMIYRLDDNKSKALMILKGEILKGFYTASFLEGEGFEDEAEYITIRFNEGKSEINTEIIEDRVHISQEITIYGSLVEYTPKEVIFDDAQLKEVEKHIAKHINTDLKNTLEILQSLENDSVGYGLHVRANHPDFFDNHNWHRQFAYADIETKTTVKLQTVGITH